MTQNKKLKVIVCGTTFGQFYMEVLHRHSDEFEFMGIVAGGSERSRVCSKTYGVPLYRSIDELPEKPDIACVIIRSGALGGRGTDIAESLMNMGVHIIQEQPIHKTDTKSCIQSALKNKVNFMTGDLYVHLPEVKKLISGVKTAMQLQKPAYIHITTCPQVSYPMVDIMDKMFSPLPKWSFDTISEANGPFQIASGRLGDVPLYVTYNNQIDPADPDNYMHMLHRFTIGFEGGRFELPDTHGPLMWMPRLHIPTQGYNAGIYNAVFPEHMKEYTSNVVGAYNRITYSDMVLKTWVDAVYGDLSEMKDMILGRKNGRARAQREILCTQRWHEFTQTFGFASLKKGCSHQPLDANIVLGAVDTEE